eukprot:CAMPEP_0177500844 /NCGR_PEP_ID=MMETSP0369-20130122/36894_1 /TAXON_ID=447022 ORGANISM="Scrippsiella hangoei-like, Strain SHHI-4" /NCGR_SAMPLE_ID=MMETSP0369 /ASSEMBLY_ACC=CAM_ASM_000364 /LENGTH=47 /DNA_ID= /DNA_START= /DNA_END= /DNA_ORIENTATION=
MPVFTVSGTGASARTRGLAVRFLEAAPPAGCQRTRGLAVRFLEAAPP